MLYRRARFYEQKRSAFMQEKSNEYLSNNYPNFWLILLYLQTTKTTIQTLNQILRPKNAILSLYRYIYKYRRFNDTILLTIQAIQAEFQ